MEESGKRLKKFEEVYNNIIFVKSNNLENHYFNQINKIRETEMVWNKKYFVNSAIVISGLYVTSCVLYISTFATFILSGNIPTVSLIFTFIGVYENIQYALNFFPSLVSNFVDVIVSSQRLTNFLFFQDRQPP